MILVVDDDNDDDSDDPLILFTVQVPRLILSTMQSDFGQFVWNSLANLAKWHMFLFEFTCYEFLNAH